jgi:septal ring factor EnvC (AmiA/AmiB activator)
MQERQFTILFSFAFALNGAAVYGFVPAATARFDASLAGFARGLFSRAAAPRCRPSQIRLASQPHADMAAAGAETMALFMEIEALRRTQEKLEATIDAFRSEITAIRRAQVELEAQIAEKDEEIRILQAKATENANRLVLEQAK